MKVKCVFVWLILTVGTIATQAAIKDKGLILYFSFDKSDGGKIEDLTIGKHHGKLLKGKIDKKNKVIPQDPVIANITLKS